MAASHGKFFGSPVVMTAGAVLGVGLIVAAAALSFWAEGKAIAAPVRQEVLGERAVALVLAGLGFFLVLRRQSDAAGDVAPESVGGNVKIAVFALAFALALVLAVAAVRWIAHKPAI